MQEIPESVRATVNSIHTELKSGEGKRWAVSAAGVSKPEKGQQNPGAVKMTPIKREAATASEGKGLGSSGGKVLEFATRLRQSSGKEVALNA